MNKLFLHRLTLRHNVIALIGLCLCVYFTYHILHGERSVTRLISLSREIESVSQMNDNLFAEREALEKRVAMMRPGSINRDLLEEQVRVILGYKNPDEIVILSN